MTIELELFAEPYLIARLDASNGECLGRIGGCDGQFVSVTRTDHEVSLVVEDSQINRTLFHDAREIEPHWRAFRIVGSLEFELVGILANLTAALAAAEIPVFCLSTFLTDYILVKEQHVSAATVQLRKADYKVLAKP